VKVVIVGCGDIGARTARRWQARGATVEGIVRSRAGAQRLQTLGIVPLVVDLGEPASLSRLEVTEALVYYFAPPPAQGSVDTRIRNFLAAVEGQRAARFVYLSTTGVYGDHGGELVSESTVPNPPTVRGRRRLDAERAVLTWSKHSGTPAVILRVGGIYGPGRLPLDRIRAGIPVLHEHLAPATNRIHADDLGAVCEAAGLRGQAGRVYNVSDGQAGNMTQYFYAIADAAGLPRPPAVDWDEAQRSMSAGMLSYLRESRRLDTCRMQQELRVSLRYPTLEQGLASCPELSARGAQGS